MNFKTKVISCSLLTLSAFGALADELNAGVVHFTGEIIEPSCIINGNDGVDNNVPLGTYPTSLFTGVGVQSDSVPFSIELKDCPLTSVGLPNIHLTFGGPTVSGSNNLLSVSSASATAATNVGIAISLQGSSTLLPMDGSDETTIVLPLPANAGDTTIADFTARYQATALPVTAGPADADMTVNILYR